MVRVDNTRTPAIVAGTGQTGLGTLRCLRLAGIPAYVAGPPDDFVRHSRWYRPVPGTHWDGAPGAGAETLLADLPLPRVVVVPGRDDTALWLADVLNGTLGERVLASVSSRATMEVLQDKEQFGRFLAAAGIPHPRTFAIHSEADIVAIPFEQLDRVFFKPADSQHYQQKFGRKGSWAESREECMNLWREASASGLGAVAQEYVPGAADQHYFIDGFRDRTGALTGLFARRRLRISPPDFGNSSYCESIPLQEVAGALDSLAALLEKLSYRGIFSAEFKRDARDGVFRILEINSRAWWYVEFAARCGVNVVEMAWRDAQGLPAGVAGRDYVTGAGCVNLREDLNVTLFRRGRERPPMPRVLRQWLRGHLSVFRWDDPWPGLLLGIRSIWHGGQRLMRRLGPGAPEP
jgi:predicted ATP-grasp superfamily ATP-dependent carboligase